MEPMPSAFIDVDSEYSDKEGHGQANKLQNQNQQKKTNARKIAVDRLDKTEADDEMEGGPAASMTDSQIMAQSEVK